MSATQSTRYIRPKNYARTYLTDRQVLIWKHNRTGTWVTAIYNRETDNFTGIYSWGEIILSGSFNQIGVRMARHIGRTTCDAWAEFKTITGESILRLDL